MQAADLHTGKCLVINSSIVRYVFIALSPILHCLTVVTKSCSALFQRLCERLHTKQSIYTQNTAYGLSSEALLKLPLVAYKSDLDCILCHLAC